MEVGMCVVARREVWAMVEEGVRVHEGEGEGGCWDEYCGWLGLEDGAVRCRLGGSLGGEGWVGEVCCDVCPMVGMKQGV